jgi:hypothetical protein
MVALRLEGRWRRSLLWPLAAAIYVAFAFAATTAAAAEPIRVLLDQAKLIKLPERVSTIVIGNPLIADASLQPGGMMVVTGKGFGSTNLIALDRGGSVLLERPIQVQGPGDHVVVVYRGADRESYSCTPKCEPRITLGDSNAFFNGTLAQIGARNGQAQGNAAAR